MIDTKIENKWDCMGCSACYSVCPKSCIDMEADNEGFKYPKVDYTRCVKCSSCIDVCPIISTKYSIKSDINAYASISADEDVRKNSSSGGIFSLIAEQLINVEGVVFGAEFDNQFQVRHSYVERNEEISKFRGSKYIQSDMRDSYKEAKRFLENGRKVLFTGTPCQIAGLKNYLQVDYEYLYCQDIICQGVPSPLVWNKYLKSRIKKNGKDSKIKSITLRSKEKSWLNYEILIEFESGYIYNSMKNNDSFIKVFMKYLSIRPSCFFCKFKGSNRCSDITLGDFWGIQNIAPSLNDDKGTSLVLINTSKGKELFSFISKSIINEEVEFIDSIKNNPMYSHSVNLNERRDSFFSDLYNIEFDSLVGKYCKKSLIVSMIRKLKILLKDSLS